jgi:hypothetical protein
MAVAVDVWVGSGVRVGKIGVTDGVAVGPGDGNSLKLLALLSSASAGEGVHVEGKLLPLATAVPGREAGMTNVGIVNCPSQAVSSKPTPNKIGQHRSLKLSFRMSRIISSSTYPANHALRL